MLHGVTAVLSPAAPPRALPKVLFIISTRPCIPKYSSVPLHIHGTCTWYTETQKASRTCTVVGFTASDKPSCLPQDASSVALVYQSDCIILLSEVTNLSEVGSHTVMSQQHCSAIPKHPYFLTKTRQNQLTRIRKYIKYRVLYFLRHLKLLLLHPPRESTVPMQPQIFNASFRFAHEGMLIT